jgi:hypothetical protein
VPMCDAPNIMKLHANFSLHISSSLEHLRLELQQSIIGYGRTQKFSYQVLKNQVASPVFAILKF